MKIKANDKVKIIKGKDRGKEGKVVQVFPKEGKVVVEGANVMFKHIKSRGQGQPGERVEFNAPIPVENVMLISPHTGKPVRVNYKVLEDGKKVRVCNKTREVIE